MSEPGTMDGQPCKTDIAALMSAYRPKADSIRHWYLRLLMTHSGHPLHLAGGGQTFSNGEKMADE